MALIRKTRLKRRFCGGQALLQKFLGAIDARAFQIPVGRGAGHPGKGPDEPEFAHAGEACHILQREPVGGMAFQMAAERFEGGIRGVWAGCGRHGVFAALHGYSKVMQGREEMSPLAGGRGRAAQKRVDGEEFVDDALARLDRPRRMRRVGDCPGERGRRATGPEVEAAPDKGRGARRSAGMHLAGAENDHIACNGKIFTPLHEKMPLPGKDAAQHPGMVKVRRKGAGMEAEAEGIRLQILIMGNIGVFRRHGGFLVRPVCLLCRVLSCTILRPAPRGF